MTDKFKKTRLISMLRPVKSFATKDELVDFIADSCSMLVKKLFELNEIGETWMETIQGRQHKDSVRLNSLFFDGGQRGWRGIEFGVRVFADSIMRIDLFYAPDSSLEEPTEKSWGNFMADDKFRWTE